MIKVDEETFDCIVEAAIDSIPDRFLDELENVTFFWEEEPDPESLGEDYRPDLLGLYDGVNIYDRAATYGDYLDMPDAITVFKGPHERMCNSLEELAEEVRRTVVHEVGHYFGMDEDDLERMGYL